MESFESKLEKIKSIESDVEVSEPRDDAAKNESVQFKGGEKEALAELAIQDAEFDLTAKKKFADRIYGLVVGWIFVVTSIVVLSGYSIGPRLSDGVLIALITGMSANVIGLLAIVITYLFPKRGKH